MNWRERRKLAYLYKEFNDYNLEHEFIDLSGDKLTDLVIEFFVRGSQLIFPAKSYFVAIVYAACLEKHFNIPFIEALSYDDLLIDDKYFVPYSSDKLTYDKIFAKIGDIWQYESIKPTVKYFEEEFLINDTEF